MEPVVVLQNETQRQVIYELQPKQMECFNLTPLAKRPDEPYTRHIGYGGAAGGGKSHLARAVGVAACMRWPGCTGIIFRSTKAEVKANHLVKFKFEVPDRWPGRKGDQVYHYNGEDMCAEFFNKSRLYFGFLKDQDDLRRYQGIEFDFMIFEESTHYPWDLVRWLTGNRLRATVDGARPFVLYPSNPGNVGHHWYKRLFITKRYYSKYREDASMYSFVQAKVPDNFVLCDRDPGYVDELSTLPEPYRSWLRDGDWNAGLGLALSMCDADIHIVDKFRVPEHWNVFGSFDWGYAHPYSFGIYAVNEDGRHFKVDTITYRHQSPPEIAEMVKARCEYHDIDWRRMRHVYAGHDCWHDHKARQENVPTLAEEFMREGLVFVQANISRVAGLNNLRKFMSWDNEDGVPGLVFMDTEGNQKCFEQLEGLPSDPDNPEDALKQSADEFGNGGDDIYDETRYAVASRQLPSGNFEIDRDVNAWSPEALELEYERNRKSRLPQNMQKNVLHPEFGAQV
jgi:hypothetical protein